MSDLSFADAFALGQAETGNRFLYSSPMWFAYEAGRAARAHLDRSFRPRVVKMSRGYSVRAGDYLFRFTGEPLAVTSVEAN
jgi:hypothetical protein